MKTAQNREPEWWDLLNELNRLATTIGSFVLIVALLMERAEVNANVDQRRIMNATAAIQQSVETLIAEHLKERNNWQKVQRLLSPRGQ